ncbi:hypothetical protein T4D_16937 [Trichinella pseudospiralis]|uniref:Uncharacterized protein n=1 Tax=Trichinella pseudospiralis TaxID=6337 RepID=A0A0V1DRT1_TRIPS|nr:hypothetical protein T4D_16937 [Trichinella pseudospiralis]
MELGYLKSSKLDTTKLQETSQIQTLRGAADSL